MELTVLDNASDDATPDVVKRFQERWPLLKYQRNLVNLGGNPNYLRALEVGDSTYCWVIGDDDKWFLDDLSELIWVLNAGHADVIRLGWLVSEEERGEIFTIAELACGENLFFASVSMISSVIVKRSLLTASIPESYLTIGDAYPQLVPFFKNAMSADLTVYSLSKGLMTHTPNPESGYFMSDLEWIACYCRSIRFLESASLKDKVSRELMAYLAGIFPRFPRIIFSLCILLYFGIKSKAYGFDQLPYLLTIIGYSRMLRPAAICTAIIYVLTPVWLIRVLVSRARGRAGLSPDLDLAREEFLAGRRKRL
jgi:glycosyltransferase involved in cell wall biosynthesis